MRKTPLYETHKALSAKFTEFGGWEMPVRYSGLADEHNCVRQKVGLFDVSHMGELFVNGEGALDFLQEVSTNDLSGLEIGNAQYSLLCNEQGGVVDDIIIYRLAHDEYLICVNASNTDKDFNWLKSKNSSLGIDSVNLRDESSRIAQLAIQGPLAATLVQRAYPEIPSLHSIKPFSFVSIDSGEDIFSELIARTGYTGEDGFEIFCRTDAALGIWEKLYSLGQDLGVQAIGLGARDTLRLEAAFPLHGHELREDLIALSSNVGWTIKFKKGSFIGKEALLHSKESGPINRLIGFEVSDRGIVREGAKIFNEEKTELGWVSSGTMTPTIGKAIGLAFVDRKKLSQSTELFAEVRGRELKIKKNQNSILSEKKMNNPNDRVYTKDHEWLKPNGDIYAVGISHYAQEELGDIVYVELPEVGTRVSKGESFATIESVKAVSDIYAPCDGEVMESNTKLQDNPELINSDAFQDGWIVKIKSDSSPESELLSVEDYNKLLDEISK